MGSIRQLKKKFSRPRKPWDRKRLAEEAPVKKQYGLKNKREIWRLQEMLRLKRHSARRLLALPLEQRLKREKELIGSLVKIGMLDEKAILDDVLTLNLREILERRLQTIVLRKSLANTPKQARQFIVHGHIALNGKRITKPSYIVKKGEDALISYYGKPMVVQTKAKEETKKEFEAIEKEAKEAAGVETLEEKTEEIIKEEVAEIKGEEK